MKYLSYKQQPVEDRWDAIVIGSGIGGLTAAALLAKRASKKVLVLERHYTAGGYTHVFHRPGYEWDVGVHYIGQVHDRKFQLRRAFDELTEGKLEWTKMPDVYDRVLMGDRTYEFPSGAERFRARMAKYFPDETEAIDRYMAAVKEANRSVGAYFAEKAIPRPLAAVAGGLMRRAFLKWSDRTTADVLRQWTQNKELIGVLTAQWGDYGLVPSESSFAIHAMIAGHYFEGGSYPVGGASRIAETIVPVIEKAGGKILVSAEVAGILMQNGRAAGVRMADGKEIRAGVVISDAGIRNTFEKLVPEAERGELQAVREELGTASPSLGHLSLYVGLKHSAAELGLEGTNLWIYPGPDHETNMRRFAEDPSAPFPAVYISFPSAKDPDFERRHPGRATIEVITMAPNGLFDRWGETRWQKRGDDYEALKNQFASRLQAALEQHVPAVAGKIDHAELSTPLSTRHFMNYQQGEIYGVSVTPRRFRLRCLAPRTPVRNLYLTGQDACTPGVAGAMIGGALAASAITGRNLMAK